MLDQMRAEGYFGGASGGGGMRAGDKGAPFREAAGRRVAQLQEQARAGQLDANSYYNAVRDALSGIWQGAGVPDIFNRQNNLYKQFGDYGQIYNSMRGTKV